MMIYRYISMFNCYRRGDGCNATMVWVLYLHLTVCILRLALGDGAFMDDLSAYFEFCLRVVLMVGSASAFKMPLHLDAGSALWVS